MRRQIWIILLLFLFGNSQISAQLHEGKYKGAIYQEKDVPEYRLPEVLRTFEGKAVKSKRQWKKQARPQILEFFEQEIYGEVPTPYYPIQQSHEIIAVDSNYLEGLCTRKDIRMTFRNEIGRVVMPVVLITPNITENAVPVILHVNGGDIRGKGYDLSNPQNFGHTRNGTPLRQLMLRGIGVASLDYQAYATDRGNREGKVSGGIANLYFQPDQEYTKENEWGMIAIWAHAVSKAMDYLETDPKVKPAQVAPMGCSISGKVALWAAATDERFGMAILATAGHGGDAIWRREFGETLANMCEYLPTWVCRNANKHADNVHEMPVDQHQLMATLAPRPFYVSNAQHDLWADQKGQWIGTYHAAPPYGLFDKKVAFVSSKQPPLDSPILESTIGYHVRSGFHGLDLYDWEQYMKFIEYHFLNIPIRSVHEIYYPEGKLIDHFPNQLQNERPNYEK